MAIGDIDAEAIRITLRDFVQRLALSERERVRLALIIHNIVKIFTFNKKYFVLKCFYKM